jgi:hypothetical protein
MNRIDACQDLLKCYSSTALEYNHQSITLDSPTHTHTQQQQQKSGFTYFIANHFFNQKNWNIKQEKKRKKKWKQKVGFGVLYILKLLGEKLWVKISV